MPKGWRDTLDESTVRSVLVIERYSSRGLFILSKPDEQGYAWVRLCVGHPYANKCGWQRLHRYLMMRTLGRKLEWYEHVHHENESDKTTTDIRKLSLTMAEDHGQLHYARRITKGGRHIPLWSPRDKRGRFTKMPTDEVLSEVVSEAVDVATSSVLASEVPF